MYEGKRLAYFDLETTQIPSSGVFDVAYIHCIGIKINNESTLMFTSRFLPLPNYGGTLRNALDLLNSCDYIIGHNIIGFDCIVVEELLGELTAPRLDTLLLAKMIYTKDSLIDYDITNQLPTYLYGSFSLEAFGKRLGNDKDSYSDWSGLTLKMCHYCTQDVEVTYDLFQQLITEKYYPPENSIALENQVANLISHQQHQGFYYDVKGARDLMQKLLYEQLSIELRLSKQFKPLYLADGPIITPAGARRNKLYIPDETYNHLTAIAYHPHQYTTLKNGKIRFKKYKYFSTPHRLVYSYTLGEYQKITLTKFDAGSRHKIRHWLLTMYNFTFSTYTAKGNTKVDGSELSFLGEAGVDLMRYLKVVKDISEVRGILDITDDQGFVHGRVDTVGAATHRCTHSKPNVAQTSQDPAFRKLYTAPPSYTLVGADLANIEVRVLAHFLTPYDNGEYAKAVLSKDMHWYHASLAGFIDPSIEYDEHNPLHKKARNKSKAFFFAFLYSAGDTIRGHTLWTDDCLPDYTPEEYSLAKTRVEKRLITIEDNLMFPLKKDKFVLYTEELILMTIYGKRIADTFLDRMSGIKELIADCELQSRTTGYLKMIDNRYLSSRSPHSSLNLLLQGSAGIIAKQWMVNYTSLSTSLNYWQSAFIHDEFQCTCIDADIPQLMVNLEEGAALVTTQFNMNLPIQADAVSGLTWSDTH